MTDLIPEAPRGYVRDIRVRWALEEAGLPYRVDSVPFRDSAKPTLHERGAEHFSHQPSGQVPWLTDGDISIFESGAILLYLFELFQTWASEIPRRNYQLAITFGTAVNVW